MNAIDTNTLFHTASVTKLFTSVLALQLIQEGRLSLEDTIGKFIPKYPEPYSSTVKIIQLLTHTSGIKLMDDVDYLITINTAENVDELIAVQIDALKVRNLIHFREGNTTTQVKVLTSWRELYRK